MNGIAGTISYRTETTSGRRICVCVHMHVCMCAHACIMMYTNPQPSFNPADLLHTTFKASSSLADLNSTANGRLSLPP